MICPYCKKSPTRVIDSRPSPEVNSIRRRRECIKCHKRFTTYEHIEEIPLAVKKGDGRREAFDRGKILHGIITACQKRPISMGKIESLVADIEKTLRDKHRPEREIPSSVIGEAVMKKLHELDEVAYVRFASVYRQFKDATQFMREAEKVRRNSTFKTLFNRDTKRRKQ